mmetsp:Transcript_45743/g.138997  ORF Transcript_45743/g.138997 Transcript_45743/m.138997 type:complete len:181 (-) Transcript_45743:656-1198(-)
MGKKAAERREREAFQRLVGENEKSRKMSSQLLGLSAAIRCQASVMNETDKDIRSSDRKIESLRLERERLLKSLRESRREAIHHMTIREQLEEECQKLRTDLLRLSKVTNKPIKGSLSRIHHIPSLAVEQVFGRKGASEPRFANLGQDHEHVVKECSEELTLEELARRVRRLQHQNASDMT